MSRIPAKAGGRFRRRSTTRCRSRCWRRPSSPAFGRARTTRSPIVCWPRSASSSAGMTYASAMSDLEPATLIIFGGAGDLAHRKLLPALYNLHVDGLLPVRFAVIGVGRRDLTDQAYGEFARSG